MKITNFLPPFLRFLRFDINRNRLGAISCIKSLGSGRKERKKTATLHDGKDLRRQTQIGLEVNLKKAENTFFGIFCFVVGVRGEFVFARCVEGCSEM
jgi:hypothetical protein